MTSAADITVRPAGRPIDRTVRLPGSKSITNRALLAAAMADGRSRVDGALLAEDTKLMIDALATLGVMTRVDRASSRVDVEGVGGRWPVDEGDIFCGNAGTVIRFLCAACAGAFGTWRLDGVPRMRRRPIGDLVDALRALGARIEYEGDEGFCPLTVHGRGLRGGQVAFRSPASSQFVSAVLLAAPYAAGDVMIEVEGGLPSAPYVAMTLAVLRAFGVSAVEDGMTRFIVPGGQRFAATHYAVEPDASAASYFFAAAAVTGGRVTVEGLGSASAQGDREFPDVLARMGCRVDQTADRTTVHGPADGGLRGVDVDLGAMPDVAPTLAVVAAFADGPTRIRGVGNLRIKESDRLTALATELGRLGVESELHDEGITVRPVKPLTPAVIQTYDDHRIAMSFAIAGLRLDGVVIRNPGCVSKTFPGFFELWAELGV